MEVSDNTGVLRGYRAIADFTGLGIIRVAMLVKMGILPHFKLEGTVSADRDALLQWAQARYEKPR